MSVTIRDAMTDPALFGGQFSGASWAPWRALLAGFYGLPLDRAGRRLFHRVTGRSRSPLEPCEELWLVVGRRGGKSQAAALLAVFEACFKDHTEKLAPGEIATVMVLAADRKQARSVMRYTSGLIESNPMLARMVVRQGADAIELSNRATIEVHTASFRAVRGYSVACCICDEVAFWRSEDSQNPDFEIINAIRPAMATLGGKLIALSSPYARRGALWGAYKRHYGKDSAILVAKAPSRAMNPTLPQRIVDEAMARDPAAASAEYLAEFRTDVETFVSREVIEKAQRPAPLELPFMAGTRYVAFVDPAGGGKDEFTLAIAHEDDGRGIVDVVRAQRGTPAAIVAEYAQLLKQYGVREATADRYAGSWPADEFQRHGIRLTQAAKPKSDLYRDALASFNSGRVELPPDERLATQFATLERRTARGGRDSIDHPPGGHDDRANAVAGVLSLMSRPTTNVAIFARKHHIGPRRAIA